MLHSVTIRSSVDELDDASLWIGKHLPLGVTTKIHNNILLVAQELITNAIIHGNQSVEHKTINITLQNNEHDITLSIEDEGRGLPSLPTKEESKSMNYLEENGRGMKLVVLLSDEAIVKRNKIIVTFKI